MAMTIPTPLILRISLNASFCHSFLIHINIERMKTVSSKRYHTNKTSFSLISNPSMAVNPARNTAMCS